MSGRTRVLRVLELRYRRSTDVKHAFGACRVLWCAALDVFRMNKRISS